MVNTFGIFLFTNISPTKKQYLEEKIPLEIMLHVRRPTIGFFQNMRVYQAIVGLGVGVGGCNRQSGKGFESSLGREKNH